MQLERESPRVSQRRVDQISYLIKGHQAILNIFISVVHTIHNRSTRIVLQPLVATREGCHMTPDAK